MTPAHISDTVFRAVTKAEMQNNEEIALEDFMNAGLDTLNNAVNPQRRFLRRV